MNVAPKYEMPEESLELFRYALNFLAYKNDKRSEFPGLIHKLLQWIEVQNLMAYQTGQKSILHAQLLQSGMTTEEIEKI